MLVMAAGQAAMAKHHSRVEVATKLAQANDLARQGKLKSEIARTLGALLWTNSATSSAAICALMSQA